MTDSPTQRKRILVVGDWLVDDNWVLGTHQSLTSIRIGQQHYRALHSLKSRVQSASGAGRTASLLLSTHDMVGVGLWHAEDKPAWEAMLYSENESPENNSRTPFRLGDALPKFADNIKEKYKVELINIGNCGCLATDSFATTRAFRFYQIKGSQINQLERLDWEHQAPNTDEQGSPIWLASTCNESCPTKAQNKGCNINSPSGRVATFFEESIEFNTVDAVVIEDLCKGVISCATIEALAQKDKLKNVPWFVSTKAWRPDWLKILKRESIDVRLFVIPDVAAKAAIRAGDVSTWITRSGLPSMETLGTIKTLHGEICKPGSLCCIVALPEGLRILAYDPSGGKEDGLVQPKVAPWPSEVATSLGSAYFAQLIVDLLGDEKPENKQYEFNLEELIKRSLRLAAKWTKSEANRLKNPSDKPEEITRLEPPKHGAKPGKPPKSDDDSDHLGRVAVRCFSWTTAIENWTKAFRGIGVIERSAEDGGANSKPNHVLELYRAMSAIDDYVCCVPSRRAEVERLVRRVESFKKPAARERMSCMLIARPGSGKTHLVRSLAQAVGLRFLQFDITQMLSKHDILDSFDTIVTTQAQERNTPLLVLVDEINATIGGQPVYEAFLAPLEDGEYVRAGKRFKFDPCLWIFAGTAPPDTSDPRTKASDFMSRLTAPIVDLTRMAFVGGDDDTLERVEAVYMGAALICHAFPDVRHVSSGILNYFYRMPQPVSVRTLKGFVKSFQSVQYGRLTANNVPRSDSPVQNRDEILFESKANEMIEIIAKPSSDIPEP